MKTDIFGSITPEEAGISSEHILEYLRFLETVSASTHGLLMMHGNRILTEGYRKPFGPDYCHRMYSQTKSFVAIAIGLLLGEKKLSLDDRIIDYFPDKSTDRSTPGSASRRYGKCSP